MCYVVQVDLEHNHYRSFQGLTCLMQISTRTEDFIVDTLKLRIHVGPYLREAFKDLTKKKVCLLTFSFFGFMTDFFIFVISFNLFRSCMEQIEILCGFKGTLAYTFAICLTLDRFCTLTLLFIYHVILFEFFLCYFVVSKVSIFYSDSMYVFV